MRFHLIATAAVLLGLVPALSAADSGPAKKRLLVITESRGFVHGVVKRDGDYRGVFTRDRQSALTVNGHELTAKDTLQLTIKDGKTTAVLDGKEVPFSSFMVTTPCLVEKTLIELGAKNGLEVVCSQDSRQEITAENLAKFDAVFFYTTGELPLSETQKADLLAFVRSGKGFAGSHCATDTFYRWAEYGNLIGAYFDGHPWTQKITAIVEDTKHPATKHLGASFVIDDEIYQFRGPYDRSKLHVLMRLDMKSVSKGGKRKDNDNALAWVKEYGKGRVFYTALGHRDQVWKDERFQKHMVGGLRYVMGLEQGDATPSNPPKNRGGK
jgi:type 1 glutamine amidotransferase